MTKQKNPTWQNETDPDKARYLWKQERSVLFHAVIDKRQAVEKARLGEHFTQERQAREELEQMETDLRLLDEAWKEREKSVRVAEYSNRDALLTSLRVEIDRLDQDIFSALDALAEVATKRANTQLKLANLQNRISASAIKYDLDSKISETERGLLPWGRLKCADSELPSETMAAYTGRFVRLFRGRSRPHSLTELVRKG